MKSNPKNQKKYLSSGIQLLLERNTTFIPSSSLCKKYTSNLKLTYKNGQPSYNSYIYINVMIVQWFGIDLFNSVYVCAKLIILKSADGYRVRFGIYVIIVMTANGVN